MPDDCAVLKAACTGANGDVEAGCVHPIVLDAISFCVSLEPSAPAGVAFYATSEWCTDDRGGTEGWTD